MNEIMIFYLIASFAIGFYNREHKFGFMGWFMMSIILTPIVTLIIRFLTK